SGVKRSKVATPLRWLLAIVDARPQTRKVGFISLLLLPVLAPDGSVRVEAGVAGGRAELVLDLEDPRWPPVGVDLEAGQDGLVDRSRNRWLDQDRRGELAPLGVENGNPLLGIPASEHAVHRRAEVIDIGPLIDLALGRLLGGHVLGRPLHAVLV